MQPSKHRLGSEASYIDWSECASLHKYDVAAGTATPNPPVVGSWVTLNVDVIFNDDVTVNGLFINVLFTSQGQTDPVNLYNADFLSKTPQSFGAGDEYEDSLSWPIPSFAPLGHYSAQIIVHGASAQNDNWACIAADFDISS